jgi:cyclopropane fatty-acyl-phospholipid synthase-like methyltransferase
MLDADSPTRTVQDGYDRMASHYVEWAASFDDTARHRYTRELLERLSLGASLLDLGCGAGVPSTRRLAEHCTVTGVDVSAQQLRLAQSNVPRATFVHADLMSVELTEAAFDAVTAFYVLAHVPREALPGAFARVRRWLRPSGWFLATLGAGDTPGSTEEWNGVPMFFSSYAPARNRELLLAAGFELAVEDVVDLEEPEGTATFHWVLAQSSR